MNLTDYISQKNYYDFVEQADLRKGLNYPIAFIKFKEDYCYEDEFSDGFVKTFRVKSERKNSWYEVGITVSPDNELLEVLCTCPQYSETESCKHVAAVLVKCPEIVFEQEEENLDYSAEIIKKYMKSGKPIIRKEVKLELLLNEEVNDSYYYYYKPKIEVKIKIGVNKMYSMNTHLSRFITVYEEKEGKIKYGKEFIYNPEEHYFSEENTKLLEDCINYYYNQSERNLKRIIKGLKNTKYIFNDYICNGFEESFPLKTSLSKSEDEYMLNIDSYDIEPITSDYEYVFYQGKMYHLSKKQREFLEDVKNEGIECLRVTKDIFPTFTKGLFPIIKDNIEIDSDIDDLIITNNIKTKLYFDLRSNIIIANPKFVYGTNEIDYFNTSDNILRDSEYETEVISDLVKCGFEEDKNKFVIKDLELQVKFLENKLEELAEKYEVFTTEKFKSTNIKKKTSITSMFSIGHDNIFSYNFDLGDIKSEELVNIFKEIKNKNKYYRLKNGDILNLEDESLKELESLSEELELTDEEIKDGKGSILKYRAIYLDSLKNNKYNIINTDNLFDNFINDFYKYKDSDLTLSKKELKVLRDYQVTGVKWLYNVHKTGFGGILADEMGLGKTIQVIYYMKQILNDDKDAKFLVVVPTSLAYNWDHELNMYGKEITKIIAVGNKEKRKHQLENNKDVNCIVTTYGLLREDEELYESFNFHTMIIDEAQNIKNNLAGITKCVKRVKANTKFALTGTPLENSVLELWSIFDYIMPGYLANLTKFQSKYRIKDFDEDSELLLKGLSRQINPFILRRKKKDVIKELPDKLLNDIFIELNDEQKKIYAAELTRVKEEMENIFANESESKAKFLILPLLTKLRQICISPEIAYDNYDGGSNKIDTLVNIIDEYTRNEHKILIFSSFRKGLDLVKDTLNKANIKSYTIDGSVSSKNRIEMVDSFNGKDDVKVFLIMLKSGGTGLNLTGADVVIHLDLWWNPQAENQATDRTHRIGQTKNVEVIHLISKGTIEERILELQNKKRELSDKLIDGEIRDKNLISSLTKEDIKNLLSYENE